MVKSPKTTDFDIRCAVVRRLLESGIPRDAIRHEITLDSWSSDGRADMVIAQNNRLVGIEIKSGRDTLTRLDEQRERYSARFDSLCLILDERHFPTEKSHACFVDELRFGPVVKVGVEGLEQVGWRRAPWMPPQECTGNPRRSLHAMASMLHASEAVTVTAALAEAGKIPTLHRVPRWRYLAHLGEHASAAALRPLIADQLRQRPLNKWEAAFWSKFDETTTVSAAAE